MTDFYQEEEEEGLVHILPDELLCPDKETGAWLGCARKWLRASRSRSNTRDVIRE